MDTTDIFEGALDDSDDGDSGAVGVQTDYSSGETFSQAWTNFFSENPLTSFEQEFGLVGTNVETGAANLTGGAGGIVQSLQDGIESLERAIQGAVPSSTNLTIWLVLIVIAAIAIAFLAREVAG
jgi:hypothetical protein